MTGLVSVAMTLQDDEATVATAIESVLSQEDVRLELRLYDNRSRDRTTGIASRYLRDPRVSLTRNDRDLGPYGSLNRALAESRGTYFTPFDARSVMLEGNLARKVALLEVTGAGLAHSPIETVDGAGRLLGVADSLTHVPPYVEPPGFFLYVSPVNPIASPSVVVRRGALLALGGFDGRLVCCADWLAWMRLSLRQTFVTEQEALVARPAEDGAASDERLTRGWLARDLAAASEEIFADAAMPADWAPLRAGLVGARLALTAKELAAAGLWRSGRGHGYAAYVLAGWALAELPGDYAARGLFLELVHRAGLAAPRLPFDAVGYVTAADAAALVSEAKRLAGHGLLARLVVGASPPELGEVALALHDALGDPPGFGVDLVSAWVAADLPSNGRVVLAPFGSVFHYEAEALGVPCFPYARPTPFGRPLDPDRWDVAVAADVAA